uniref:Uncharacterized protein n=1 Tax=Anguilla anguilla TaxID=7936 RepID=A0A0E9WB12_ANGAN
MQAVIRLPNAQSLETSVKRQPSFYITDSISVTSGKWYSKLKVWNGHHT